MLFVSFPFHRKDKYIKGCNIHVNIQSMAKFSLVAYIFYAMIFSRVYSMAYF